MYAFATMYRLIFLVAFTVGAVAQCPANNPWDKLLDEHKCEAAQSLCEGLTHSPDSHKQFQGEVCLATVALAQGQSTALLGNDTGGGTLGAGYTPKAIDEAMKHINRGLEIESQDLCLHVSRLRILDMAGAFNQMATALEDSLDRYKGPDSVHIFLPLTADLEGAGQLKAALQLALILDKHFPGNHEIVGNIGMFRVMLGQKDEGLADLRQAAELAPQDPMDNWNLGWQLKGFGKAQEADAWLQKGLALDPESQTLPGARCLYAKFVADDLKDKTRGCKLERANCKVGEQTACHAIP